MSKGTLDDVLERLAGTPPASPLAVFFTNDKAAPYDTVFANTRLFEHVRNQRPPPAHLLGVFAGLSDGPVLRFKARNLAKNEQ